MRRRALRPRVAVLVFSLASVFVALLVSQAGAASGGSRAASARPAGVKNVTVASRPGRAGRRVFSGTITPGGPPVVVTTTTPGENGTLTFTGTQGQRVFVSVTSVSLTPGGSVETVDLKNPSGQKIGGTGLIGSAGGFLPAAPRGRSTVRYEDMSVSRPSRSGAGRSASAITFALLPSVTSEANPGRGDPTIIGAVTLIRRKARLGQAKESGVIGRGRRAPMMPHSGIASDPK